MDPNQQKASPVKMARAIVARGRTVSVPTGNKKPAGFTPEGKMIYAPELQHFGPNQEVELPSDEIVRLRAAGFLLDPEATMPPPAQGARVSDVGFVGQQAR